MRVAKSTVTSTIFFLLFYTRVSLVFAHEVKTATDVGATLHIEPNDNPRAGKPAKTWFILTHKGGKVIPLAECDCHLAVYNEPHKDEDKQPPLLQPTLQPVTVENYQNIPGTVITFPKPGGYELDLDGKPTDGKSFQPFELEFEATVIENSQNAEQSQTKQVPLWAVITSLGFLGVGVLLIVKRLFFR